MFAISFSGIDELNAFLMGMPQKVQQALVNKSQELTQQLVAKIGDKLNGGILQSVSGKLRDSIESTVNEGDNTVEASVFVAGDVPYAAIQEYGGITKAHIIRASQGKLLAFNWQGKPSFFAYINHPGSVIPEHSYMRSSFDEMQDDILSDFSDAVTTGIA